MERVGDDIEGANLSKQVHAAESGESAVLDADRSQAMACAVTGPVADLRAVFVLRHFEGLNYRKIGEVLEMSEPTVRGRLARARQQLVLALREWR